MTHHTDGRIDRLTELFEQAMIDADYAPEDDMKIVYMSRAINLLHQITMLLRERITQLEEPEGDLPTHDGMLDEHLGF